MAASWISRHRQEQEGGFVQCQKDWNTECGYQYPSVPYTPIGLLSTSRHWQKL